MRLLRSSAGSAKCGGTASFLLARTSQGLSRRCCEMERTLSNELAHQVGQTVRLYGWLHRRRELKSVTFFILRDRSGIAQVVVTPEQAQRLEGISEETVLSIVGTVIANPAAPGGHEIVEPEIEVLSSHVPTLPFELFRPDLDVTLPTRLDHAALALRHPRQRAAFEIAAASVAGFRSALDATGFTEVCTPKIVASATESGANVFALDYFGRPAFLAQSPQFYKQSLVGVFERVYEVGPVFRAEPHDTTRHLAEYVSLDAELGFIDDHRTVMAVLVETLRGMLAAVEHRATTALGLLGLSLPQLPIDVPTVHFADALAMISAAGEDSKDTVDLSPSHERWLGEWARREHASDFVFVTGYPMVKRPFYTHPDPLRPAYSNSFDLLFRGLELVTGGQRLHRIEQYESALTERGEDPAEYESYLEAFRYGMPPHGGFAIGLERWTARLTGAPNIRETTLFPRDRTRLAP